MEAQKGSRDIVLFILKLSTRRGRWLMPYNSHFASRTELWYLLYWMMKGPQGQSGQVWEEKIILPHCKFKSQTIQPIVSPYTNYNDRHHIKHILLAHCVLPGSSLNPISPLPKYPNRGVLGKCLLNAADSTFRFPW